MKFPDISFQHVAFLAVLLAAYIVSAAFAPAALPTISSIVSTLIGAVFINLRKSSRYDDADNDKASK